MGNSIEERAKEYLHKDGDSFLSGFESAKIDAYIQGATEQKKIDEDAFNAIVEEQVLKAIEKQRQIDIERACRGHCLCCKAYHACLSRKIFYCPDIETIHKNFEK